MVEIRVIHADLCSIAADGICTSTNPNLALMIGSGGAVRDAGGWMIQEECARLIAEEHARSGKRYVAVGSAHLTTPGSLPFRGVIHCVASDGFHLTSKEMIARCVQSALAIAEREGWGSLAMPLFGSGHAAFPADRSADAMASALASAATRSVQSVIIAVRKSEHLAIVERAMESRFR